MQTHPKGKTSGNAQERKQEAFRAGSMEAAQEAIKRAMEVIPWKSTHSR